MLVELGRVTGSYGVLGWLRVRPSGPEADALTARQVWWLRGSSGKDWVSYEVEDSKAHSGNLLAKLRGVGNREMALALKGRDVALHRDELPEPESGSYYWSDLVGLEVVNTAGERLGEVKSMFSNGAQDVMEVDAERTRLIPWVDAVVRRVDIAARRIEVEWQLDW